VLDRRVRCADPLDVRNDNVFDEVARTGGFHVSIVEGMCVDRDAVGIAQDGVVHHIDPGGNGRDGTFVPGNVVEIPTNIPNLLHDVRGSISDLISDGQAIDVGRAVFFHGIDERPNVTVDLYETKKALSSQPPLIRILSGEW